ncbi:Uncharacterized aarF domain-containing kinase 2, putative [Babesia ovata]|uniref:Uncharacterized aarF domain-containing kinase 2, putative n=1 Tax=Babesia ovata TaxID=189622 RepID=A0A2H6KJZ1_9APIC|nr:Uncharacterized aarF domain-containing kinase 2, putative [Babesia ovata]GBE63307.1 Uncharacterized aarF domain-containing kinase 2, putative [Babesia ovata]
MPTCHIAFTSQLSILLGTLTTGNGEATILEKKSEFIGLIFVCFAYFVMFPRAICSITFFFQICQVLTHRLQYGQADLGAVAALSGKDLFGLRRIGIFFSVFNHPVIRTFLTTVLVHVRVSELLGELRHAAPEGVEEKRVVEAGERGGGEGGDGGGKGGE